MKHLYHIVISKQLLLIKNVKLKVSVVASTERLSPTLLINLTEHLKDKEIKSITIYMAANMRHITKRSFPDTI